MSNHINNHKVASVNSEEYKHPHMTALKESIKNLAGSIPNTNQMRNLINKDDRSDESKQYINDDSYAPGISTNSVGKSLPSSRLGDEALSREFRRNVAQDYDTGAADNSSPSNESTGNRFTDSRNSRALSDGIPTKAESRNRLTGQNFADAGDHLADHFNDLHLQKSSSISNEDPVNSSKAFAKPTVMNPAYDSVDPADHRAPTKHIPSTVPAVHPTESNSDLPEHRGPMERTLSDRSDSSTLSRRLQRNLNQHLDDEVTTSEENITPVARSTEGNSSNLNHPGNMAHDGAFIHNNDSSYPEVNNGHQSANYNTNRSIHGEGPGGFGKYGTTAPAVENGTEAGIHRHNDSTVPTNGNNIGALNEDGGLNSNGLAQTNLANPAYHNSHHRHGLAGSAAGAIASEGARALENHHNTTTFGRNSGVGALDEDRGLNSNGLPETSLANPTHHDNHHRHGLTGSATGDIASEGTQIRKNHDNITPAFESFNNDSKCGELDNYIASESNRPFPYTTQGPDSNAIGYSNYDSKQSERPDYHDQVTPAFESFGRSNETQIPSTQPTHSTADIQSVPRSSLGERASISGNHPVNTPLDAENFPTNLGFTNAQNIPTQEKIKASQGLGSHLNDDHQLYNSEPHLVDSGNTGLHSHKTSEHLPELYPRS
ncbi:hypothetical protein K493DRAFT_335331 [Basidiobolus meristosporus CBS 931.73]|uniref:Uncharacterized protein n=1 Tax=Basidiobolus meristosporus CBS 931.73 TaxID=1314790 RepID=A0A1Y1YR35_9FUNG|nr:hypothetical protein K493DRAFT_335331 [Basidiobolus meristosporus CBS 931.73]|eukprot:ORY00498.1 hypothetical protein K493DRAFT_335331 [Basidiobolus meristosporus CBS 931.73]